MGYTEKLKNPKWQRRRLEILQRDEFRCRLCNDDKTELHVHHKKYNGDPWDSEDDDLVTVCKYCHLVYESVKEFYKNVSLYKVKRTATDVALHLTAFGIDEEYRWVIFYYYQDEVLRYQHALTDNVVKYLFEDLFPFESNG